MELAQDRVHGGLPVLAVFSLQVLL